MWLGSTRQELDRGMGGVCSVEDSSDDEAEVDIVGLALDASLH
jgi:hypothetical protein